jgi:hypothetical protein
MPSKAAQRKIAKSTVRGERDIEPYLQTADDVGYLSEADALLELEIEENEQKKLNRKRAA